MHTNATLVVVLLQGGPLDVSWLQQSDRVAAILTAWYPGQVRTHDVDVPAGVLQGQGPQLGGLKTSSRLGTPAGRGGLGP